MATYIDENGNKVEAFTVQEVEAQKAAVKAEADAVIKAKEEELVKLKEKDLNFNKVKQGEEEKEGKIKTLESELSKMKGVIIGNFKGDLLKQYAGNDAELTKKIEVEYASFSGEAVTNEEIAARMEKAARIVNPALHVNIAGAAFSAVGGRGQSAAGQNATKEETPEAKAIRSRLGISDEDLKKYGPKLK